MGFIWKGFIVLTGGSHNLQRIPGSTSSEHGSDISNALRRAALDDAAQHTALDDTLRRAALDDAARRTALDDIARGIHNTRRMLHRNRTTEIKLDKDPKRVDARCYTEGLEGMMG